MFLFLSINKFFLEEYFLGYKFPEFCSLLSVYDKASIVKMKKYGKNKQNKQTKV